MRSMNMQSRLPIPDPRVNQKLVAWFDPLATSVQPTDLVVSSVDTATNRITVVGHGFNQKGSLASGGFTPIWFENSSNSAPAGITLNTLYGLHSVSGDTFKIYPLINEGRNSRLAFDNAAFEVNEIDITGSTWTGTLRLRTNPLFFKNGDIAGRGGYSFTAADRNERVEMRFLDGQPCYYMAGFYYNGDLSTSSGPSNFDAATGVNTATDTVTMGGTHGLSTGTGVFLQKLSPTVAYPTGLSMALGTAQNPEPYFVAAPTTTTIQFYDTRANALTGGATGRIDITAAGSGLIELVQVGQAVGKHVVPTIGDTRFSNNMHFNGKTSLSVLILGREEFQPMTENDQKRRITRHYWTSGQYLFGGFSTSASTPSPIEFPQNASIVDTAINRINLVNHGLTQSSKVRASYPSGSTQMGSVVAGTDYFVRYISKDAFELFATRSNSEGTAATGRIVLGSLGTGSIRITTIDNGNGTRFLAGNTTRTFAGAATSTQSTGFIRAYITNQATAISGTAITLTGHNFTSGLFTTACFSIDGAGSLPTGVSAGTVYGIRRINSTQFSAHPTVADAINNTNAISLTAGTGNLVVTCGTFSITDHGFPTGMQCRLLPRAGTLPPPFSSSANYFTRTDTTSQWRFFPTLADAQSGTNEIVPTAMGTAATVAIIPSAPGFALGDDNVGLKRYQNRNIGAMYFQIDASNIKTAYGYSELETNPGGGMGAANSPTSTCTMSLFNSADGDTPSGGFYRSIMFFNDQLRGSERTSILDWFWQNGMLLDGGSY